MSEVEPSKMPLPTYIVSYHNNNIGNLTLDS